MFDSPQAVASFVRETVLSMEPPLRFPEMSWFELKREWHRCNTPAGLSEFIKDLCALANVGRDSLMVYGVDNSTGQGLDAPVTQSGLKNAHEIQQKIEWRVFPPIQLEIGEFSIDGKTLSYVHIAPSHNRPHLVEKWTNERDGMTRNFRNALFWRTGEKVLGPVSDPPWYPDRTALELMFQDRERPRGRLSVGQWAGPHMMQRSSMLNGEECLVTPIRIDNVGTTSNSVTDAYVRVCRVQEQVLTVLIVSPACQYERAIEYGGAEASLDKFFPLHIPPGDSAAIGLLVPCRSVQVFTPCSGAVELRVTIRIRDIFGCETEGKMRYVGTVGDGWLTAIDGTEWDNLPQ